MMIQPKQLSGRVEQSIHPGDGRLQRLRNRVLAYQEVFAGEETFRCAIEEALRFVPCEGERVYTRILREDADSRLVLLGLHRAQPFPVHDHAGAASCQLVLHGSVRIRHYREAASINRAMVRLDCVSDRKRGPGELDYIDSQRAIHGLESVSERTLVMNLQETMSVNSERHWYFPASMSPDGKQLWYRISRKQG